MGQTISFRPTERLAQWIKHTSAKIGVSHGAFIRSHLERARAGIALPNNLCASPAACTGPRTSHRARDFRPSDRGSPQLAALAKRYRDRRPDLADLCLIRMSELYPECSVITVDKDDFRIYRRNRHEMIPLIYPPRT